jgi:beta-alanine--pyruvate transaminase
MICFAKGVSNAAIPLGGVIARDFIHDAFMTGPDHLIELFHGYTYSAHPMAVAAGLATLDLYAEEDLFARAAALETKFAEAIHSLKNHAIVEDIRTIGLAAALDLAPIAGQPGLRATHAVNHAFFDQDLMVRITGDSIALSPPLIISEPQIEEIVTKLGKVLQTLK